MQFKPEVMRRYAKYIFLDVVRFSKRSAEAQSDIVNKLNSIVRHSLKSYEVSDEDCILIPTGDGMCIAIISPNLPYDVHMQIALNILESVETYNKEAEDSTRKFQVRIGINQNTDILVTDINNRPNVAGAGINMAARIMDQADGNQILVSQSVFDELQPSEKYMDKFRRYNASGKHSIAFTVHQYIDDNHIGLNVNPPATFVKPQVAEKQLTPIAAHYFAQAIKHRQELLQLKKDSGYRDDAAIILLWFLAEDSFELSNRKEFDDRYIPTTHGAGKSSFKEQYEFYRSQTYSVSILASRAIQKELESYSDYFEYSDYLRHYEFINAEGKVKLTREWPNIWKEFALNGIG